MGLLRAMPGRALRRSGPRRGALGLDEGALRARRPEGAPGRSPRSARCGGRRRHAKSEPRCGGRCLVIGPALRAREEGRERAAVPGRGQRPGAPGLVPARECGLRGAAAFSGDAAQGGGVAGVSGRLRLARGPPAGPLPERRGCLLKFCGTVAFRRGLGVRGRPRSAGPLCSVTRRRAAWERAALSGRPMLRTPLVAHQPARASRHARRCSSARRCRATGA